MAFSLIHWLEDDQVGVVTTKSSRKGQKVHPSAFVDFKWGKAYFQAQVLKISSNRQELYKLCDKIINMEKTIDEVIHDVEAAVSTTVQKTQKNPKTKKTSKLMDSVKKRAKEIFVTISDDSDVEEISVPAKKKCSDVDVLRKEIDNLKQQLTFREAVDDSDVVPVPAKKKCSDVDVLRKEIDNLKQQLPFREAVGDVHVNNSQFEAIQKTSNYSGSSAPVESVDYNHDIESDQEYSNETQEECKPTSEISHKTSPGISPQVHDITHKMKPKPIELIEGYGVYLTKRQLDAAITSSKESPTRLMRNLLSVFFTNEVLASSSALGSRKKKKKLDEDMLESCIKFVQRQHPGTSRSLLIDATNDKCSNSRRYRVY